MVIFAPCHYKTKSKYLRTTATRLVLPVALARNMPLICPRAWTLARLLYTRMDYRLLARQIQLEVLLLQFLICFPASGRFDLLHHQGCYNKRR